jgi:hypothetical protein
MKTQSCDDVSGELFNPLGRQTLGRLLPRRPPKLPRPVVPPARIADDDLPS